MLEVVIECLGQEGAFTENRKRRKERRGETRREEERRKEERREGRHATFAKKQDR